MSLAMNVLCQHSLPYIPKRQGYIVQTPSFKKRYPVSPFFRLTNNAYSTSSPLALNLILCAYSYSLILIHRQNHIFHLCKIY
jgi:hypothetical protein